MKIKHKTNKAKRIDCQCRNHGSCSWCRGNRLYKNTKRLVEMSMQVKRVAE